jgi:hypothetical protein
MGLLIEYFAASSDDDARAALAAGPGERFPSTDGPGIEPVVNLGKLEELLTGKTFDQQLDDPASRPLIASANDNHVLVIKIGDGFVRALASADRSELDGFAVPWSQIEEFGGTADPAALADFLHRLQDLAQATISGDSAIYCWICV